MNEATQLLQLLTASPRRSRAPPGRSSRLWPQRTRTNAITTPAIQTSGSPPLLACATTASWQSAGAMAMTLSEAFALFRRLGVNAQSMGASDLRLCYLALVRRYHPDYNPQYHELMAIINCARTTILQSYRKAG
jgi:hypothetical protein